MTTRTTYREQKSSIQIGVETTETLPGELWQGGLMHPEQVQISWDYSSREGWERYIAVHGRKINKDGTISTLHQYLRVAEDPSRVLWGDPMLLSDAPEWLQKIVEKHTPPIPQNHLARWESDGGERS